MNRASVLKLAIDSFCQQNFPVDRYEIIVVDNGSTDNTKDVTDAAILAYPAHQIHYIYEPIPGLLSGRHRGVLAATGEILIFVDDDIEADHGWLRSIIDTFGDPTIQLVGGKNLPKYEITPPQWLAGFWETTVYGGRICSYLSLLDLGDRLLDINANYIWGLNFAIRKSILVKLGGFHPDCVPKYLQHLQGDGETGLTIKANQQKYRAVYQPQALVYHQVSKERLTAEYFQTRAFFQGVCNSYTAIRHQHQQISSQIQTDNMLKSSIDRLCRYADRSIKYVRDFAKKISTKYSDEDRELSQVKQQVQINLQAGYAFHQNAVLQQPELLNWILKDNYWDYRLPEFSIIEQPK